MPLKTMNGKWYGIGFGLFLGCLLFVINQSCQAQNLVPNHSFEERNDCSGLNQVHYPETGPLGWFSGGSSPDYYQTCLGSDGNSFGVPLSYWCFQYPQDGENHVGMITYEQAFGAREYFMIELQEQMIPGVSYYASFYANAGWGGPQQQMWLGSSGVGLLFTMQARQWELGEPISTGLGYAHVYQPGIISDTVNWVLVSSSFVADSAYRYVMIGNQFGNTETDTVHFADLSWNARAYILVDNVCVSADPLGCPMANSLVENTSEAVSLYPNPATERLIADGASRGTHISITDALGRCWWAGIFGGGQMLWDVRAWVRGAYVFRMQGAGTNRSFKFVLIE